MSVENISIIDLISLDKGGNLVLTISDHLEWDMENIHLHTLQNKLNAYLDAIDNGSLYESYPKGQGRNIIINVASKYFPNDDGELFLQKTKQTLESAGYRFTFSNLIK